MAHIEAYFEARLTIAVPDDAAFDSDDVRQWLQDEIGHTGVVVEEVTEAEGASDL